MAAAAADAVTRYFQFGRLRVGVAPLGRTKAQEQLIGCSVFLVRVAIPRDRSDQPICFAMYNATVLGVFPRARERAAKARNPTGGVCFKASVCPTYRHHRRRRSLSSLPQPLFSPAFSFSSSFPSLAGRIFPPFPLFDDQHGARILHHRVKKRFAYVILYNWTTWDSHDRITF